MAKRSELDEYRQILHERDDKIAELQGENGALQNMVQTLDYQLGLIRTVLTLKIIASPKTKG